MRSGFERLGGGVTIGPVRIFLESVISPQARQKPTPAEPEPLYVFRVNGLSRAKL